MQPSPLPAGSRAPGQSGSSHLPHLARQREASSSRLLIRAGESRVSGTELPGGPTQSGTSALGETGAAATAAPRVRPAGAAAAPSVAAAAAVPLARWRLLMRIASCNQRRARDKRARVGFAARKKNFPMRKTRRLSSVSLGLNMSLNTSDYDAGRPTTQHQRAENSPLMPKSTVPGPDRQLERRASTMLRANAQRSASSRCMTRN